VDCREFDAQVVRLEKIDHLADLFVRVRLTRIEGADLNLFEFDYDLTMMIFFLDPEGKKIYARYGQRTADSADALQSLEGLEYTMRSVLTMFHSDSQVFAPKDSEQPKYVGDIQGGFGRRGCYHCHNVKEALNRELRLQGKWVRESAWRFPLPENIGLTMEVNRGNVVNKVHAEFATDRIGIKAGDKIVLAGETPIHSIGDLQYALDRAPSQGELELAWERDGKSMSGKLTLAAGWRKTDISWRASMQFMVPSLRLSGIDLKEAEKTALGLDPKHLAFRHQARVHSQAQAAGIRAGDIILGVDDHNCEGMNSDDLIYMVSRRYLVGDRVQVHFLRDGKRHSVPMNLK
jgi:hypothetical protein